MTKCVILHAQVEPSFLEALLPIAPLVIKNVLCALVPPTAHLATLLILENLIVTYVFVSLDILIVPPQFAESVLLNAFSVQV